MTVTVAMARTWQPHVLDSQSAEWRSLADGLRDADDRYRRTTDDTAATWIDPAGAAARVEADEIATRVTRIGGALSTAAEVTIAAAHRVADTRRVVLTHVSSAESEGFHVADDGAVSMTTAMLVTAAQSTQPQIVLAALRERAFAHTAAITSSLSDLDAADRDGAHRLREAFDDLPGIDGQDIVVASDRTEPPAADASPDENKRWWDELSPEQQVEFIEHDPDAIGNRDGIPSATRDEANRNRLPELRDDYQQQFNEAQADLEELDGRDPGGPNGPPTMVERQQIVETIEHLEGRINDLDAVEAALTQDTDRFLLLLDTESGVQTHAAIAVDNPDTADHVSVTTGGLNTTVAGSIVPMSLEASNLSAEASRQLSLDPPTDVQSVRR